MRERLLALVGAIALVAVALVVRAAIVGGDGGGDGDEGTPKQDRPVVACTPDLRAVCAALAEAKVIAADPQSLELGEEPSDDIDGWIAWDPGPRVAGYASSTAKPDAVWARSRPIAAGSVAVLAQRTTLVAACPGTPTWRCIADEVASGDVATGVGDPGTTEGLARIRPLVSPITDDQIDQVGALDPVVASPPAGQDDARAMARELITQPGSAVYVLGPRGVLEREASTKQGQGKGIVSLLPTPETTITVVLATRTSDAKLAKAVCGALDDDAVIDAVTQIGLTGTCKAHVVSDGEAGLLYQVWKEFD